MQEYSKLIYTPPVILHRRDIEDLIKLLMENIPVEKMSLTFSFSHGDKTFRADSLEDLLQENLPPVVDSLVFSISNIDHNRWVRFDLSKRNGDYYIYALDETWFKGKIQQINEFLSTKRPWYLPVSRPWVAGLLAGCISPSLFAIIFFLFQHSILGISLSCLLLILLIWMSLMTMKGKLFPHAKLILQDSTNIFNKEILLAIATILLFIVTALEVVLKLIELSTK